jgi:hypothetical protein
VIARSSDFDGSEVSGNHLHEDYWIVKLRTKAANDIKPAKDISGKTINFPNPFSDKTQIQFGKPVESPSGFILYNVLGEEARRLNILPGTETIMLYRRKLVSGIYVYHLVSSGAIVGQGE